MKKTPKRFAVALYEAAEGKKGRALEKVILNFSKILQRENRLGWGEKIIEELEKYGRKKEGVGEAEIITARPMTERLLSEVNKFLKTAGSPDLAAVEKIILREKTDPSLVGGAVLKYGDAVWDFSFKNQLKKLKEKIIFSE